MKPGGRYPFELFRGMVHGVIFPEVSPVKAAMDPICQEVRYDQKRQRLRPQRQARQWAKAIVIELHQRVSAVNPVQICRAHHHKADAYETRGKWDQEPIADVGDDLALAPPGTARIAARPM